ncbi:transcriptional regulator NrdR [Schaalia cardiffensis]|uniref:transcriptional regulator NrdR n=1 Tax=Schaalia cardiffensis TaxID=181487 RepID=UPI0023EFBFAD|nr:transcriptional regulator NrdR [Schaalia cardiffensis]
MHCPFCHNPDSRVVDTRIADDGASIRRRRACTVCKKRFTTLETSTFQVVKRSGVVESFSRNKVVSGVKKACQGRPVTDDQLALLAQQVEEKLRSSGVSNVSSDEVGKAILPFLRDLDEIAYLRFASVYHAFNSLDDFEEAIDALRSRTQDNAPQDSPEAKSSEEDAKGETGAKKTTSKGTGGKTPPEKKNTAKRTTPSTGTSKRRRSTKAKPQAETLLDA